MNDVWSRFLLRIFNWICIDALNAASNFRFKILVPYIQPAITCLKNKDWNKVWIMFKANNKNFGTQFVIFKPLSYYFEETIGFDVKASFASRSVSRLISWYNNQVIQQKNFDKRLFSSTGLFMDWKLQTEQRQRSQCQDSLYWLKIRFWLLRECWFQLWRYFFKTTA